MVKVKVLDEKGLEMVDKVIKDYYDSLGGQPFWWITNDTLFVVSTFEVGFLRRLARYVDKDWRKHIKLIGTVSRSHFSDESDSIDSSEYLDSLLI